VARRSHLVIACSAVVAGLVVACTPDSESPSRKPATTDTASSAVAQAPDTTVAQRREIAWLESQRSFGGARLFEAAHHEDARIRLAAVVALGRIQDAAATDALIERLDDPDPQVVRQAAWALRQLRVADENTRHHIQAAAVQHIDMVPMAESWIFVEILGQHGGPGSSMILGGLMAHGIMASSGSQGRPPRVEGMAAQALAAIDDRIARNTLADLGPLTNRRGEAPWRIAWAFSTAPDSSYYRSALSLLDHPDAIARAAGARALEDLGIAKANESLIRTLTDSDWRVRAATLRALGELGDATAVAFCVSMVADRHALVREAALRALLKLGADAHLGLIDEATQDAVPAVRLLACELLARTGTSEQRLAAWQRVRSDSVGFVRGDALQFAAQALEPAAAVDTLLQALDAGDVRERWQAAAALGSFDTTPDDDAQRIRAALEKALQDDDPVVATLAAEAIGERGLTSSIAALQHTWETRPRTHADNDVLLGIASAAATLAEQPHSRPSAGLEALLHSATQADDARIVQQARVGLARLAGEEEPTQPLPTARPAPAPPDQMPRIDLGVVRVRLTTRAGTAILALDGDMYPRTVGAFLQNIEAGLHDDGVFHRVVPAFVVQGGCPRGDGWGDAGTSIPCEVGDLRYDRAGVVGMAHAGKDTGGTQFFITHLPVPRLDGRYTAFGLVVEGMDVIDQIVRGDHFRLERIDTLP
jgi:cyclophilin family peptidyl-prolyl cis-trans isomerase/HEAT repeat protein